MSLRDGGAAALVATASVLGCAAVARVVYGFAHGLPGLLLDIVLLAPMLWLAARATQSRKAACGLGLGMAFVFVLGHAIKLAYLGLPMSFADVRPAWQLLQLLEAGPRALAGLLLGGTVVAFAWTFRPRRGRRGWLLALVAYAVVLLPLAGLSMRAFTASGEVLAPEDSLRRMGGVAFAFSSLAAFDRADVAEPGIAAALRGGRVPAGPAGSFRKRNVHLVLLETTWDPLRLTAFRFSRDPWDARFRRAWEAGGRSSVLVPVFGGGTANAEFEALCGLPADPARIVFEGDILHPLPCLPRVLRAAGYATAAYHAYKAGYWSRDTAYRHIGFAQYHASGFFEQRDRDGAFLPDASMYAQVRAAQARDDGPRLAYVVSLSTHYPYDRNRMRRPDRVAVAPDVAMVRDYANALAYSTAAFMDHVESVLAADPDALVVAFGDHAPVLRATPDPYVASGMKPGRANGKIDLQGLAETPLLVIDGRRGPVAMGGMPLYALPSRVLRLLGAGAPRLPQAHVGDAAGHRMFLGQLLAPTPAGWIACHDAAPACGEALRHRRDGDLVREDLLRGARHTLRIAGATHLAGPVPMAIDRERCALRVLDWGPRASAKHQPFNRQPNGRSAIWLRVDRAEGALELVIAGESAPMTVNGGTASASFASPAFLGKPGRHPVAYRCGGQPAVALGTFTVAASASVHGALL